jgi:hypothetical protein
VADQKRKSVKDLPVRLRENVKELEEILLRDGPIDLGGRFTLGVISKDCSHKCKCKCTISGLISGPAVMIGGAKTSYTFALGTIGTNGDICTSCEHTDTDWTVSDAGVSLADKTKTGCTVKETGSFDSRTFTLTATPKGKCKCEKEDGETVLVDCTGTPDSVIITIGH